MASNTCPYCFLPPERVVCQTPHMVAIRAAVPASPGHTLLVPRRHVVSLFGLTIVEWVELGQLLTEARAALVAEFQPDGFNIEVSDGAAAGQIVKHLHVHLIPRYRGDRFDSRGRGMDEAGCRTNRQDSGPGIASGLPTSRLHRIGFF